MEALQTVPISPHGTSRDPYCGAPHRVLRRIPTSLPIGSPYVWPSNSLKGGGDAAKRVPTGLTKLAPPIASAQRIIPLRLDLEAW